MALRTEPLHSWHKTTSWDFGGAFLTPVLVSLGVPKAVVSWGGGGSIRRPSISVFGGGIGSLTLTLSPNLALDLPLDLTCCLILIPSRTLALTLSLILTLPLTLTLNFPLALALILPLVPTLTLTLLLALTLNLICPADWLSWTLNLPLILGPKKRIPTVLCRGWGRGNGLDWGGACAGNPPRGGGAKKKSRGRSWRQSEGARRVRGARSGRGRVRREGYARERGSEVGKGVL